jgi:hypothetical protein
MTKDREEAMKSEPVDRVKCDLNRALDNMRIDLDRVELLTAALSAFSKPVPEYEPIFQHVHATALTAHQI